jgi:hypothetical protein
MLCLFSPALSFREREQKKREENNNSKNYGLYVEEVDCVRRARKLARHVCVCVCVCFHCSNDQVRTL